MSGTVGWALDLISLNLIGLNFILFNEWHSQVIIVILSLSSSTSSSSFIVKIDSQGGRHVQGIDSNTKIMIFTFLSIYITFSTMIELLEKEVEKEVNVDFNEVFQRMTLDAIGTFHILELLISTFQFQCHFRLQCWPWMRSNFKFQSIPPFYSHFHLIFAYNFL